MSLGDLVVSDERSIDIEPKIEVMVRSPFNASFQDVYELAHVIDDDSDPHAMIWRLEDVL